MMILPILLVFAVNIFGAHGDCEWYEWGCQWDEFWQPIEICHCVRAHQCYQEDISEQRICTNNYFNEVDPDYVCCRNPVRFTTARPPPRRPTDFTTQRSSFLDGGPNKRPGGQNKRPGGQKMRPGGQNKKPGGSNKRPGGQNKRPSQIPEAPLQGPPKTSTKIPGRIPLIQPSAPDLSLTSTQRPITNPPTQNLPSSSQSQSQDTSQAASPTHTDCNCMSHSDCHGEDIQQGSCTNPSDVCCMSKPVTASHPQPQSPSPISTQGQTVSSSPRPQSQSPTQTSPPVDKTCTCTPFYKCFDEETSSNLTGLVNDRFATPNNDQESCLDPNDVCCYNLVKITAKPVEDQVSEDCTGSCIIIQECPYFENKLQEAQKGNADAVQELRRSVCSRTNGVLHVCCPLIVKGAEKGDDNNFGVKWPEN